jgi:hypothetical protein
VTLRQLGRFGAVKGERPDSLPVAQRRVRLKLAALAFAGARHGADAKGLSGSALAFLALSAAEYVRELVGDPSRPIEARSLLLDDEHVGGLRLAAIAYVETRHGADSTTKFAESGLAMLCEHAIAYVQGLPAWGRYAEDARDPLLLGPGES